MRHSISLLPRSPGAYRFRDARGRVLYIGRAADLRHRVASYWSDLGDRRHLAPMVGRIDRIEAVVCESDHEAAWLERNLLETTMPRWNRTAGGQEVPVWIHLDMRPRRPGLSVIHVQNETPPGVREYGPYLGGTRVRVAVAALQRILPLAYTGSGMTGSEVDMGRKLGVSSADRDWVLDATAAVLARHGDAVARARAALTGLRDEATRALAFERAARIQAESEALDWITETQRVTTDDAVDLDVFGWSTGTLVQFGIRAGRLSTWSQRAASESAAAARVAATPAEWKAFAERNAQLAAALAHRYEEAARTA